MVALFVTAAVAVLPVEFVVDCSAGVPPGFRGQKFVFSHRFVCWDGDEVESKKVTVTEGATGRPLVATLTFHLEDAGWSFEKLGQPGEEMVFVVRGSKTSPIKDVVFEGDWKPVVTRRLATRPPPAPAPKK